MSTHVLLFTEGFKPSSLRSARGNNQTCIRLVHAYARRLRGLSLRHLISFVLHPLWGTSPQCMKNCAAKNCSFLKFLRIGFITCHPYLLEFNMEMAHGTRCHQDRSTPVLREFASSLATWWARAVERPIPISTS